MHIQQGKRIIDYRKLYTLLEKIKANEKIPAKKEFFGNTPNVFVGKFGYPNINVGFLSVNEQSEQHDNPRVWAEQHYDIPKIVSLRSSLVNSNYNVFVKATSRFMDMSKEVSLAAKPVEMEIHLEKTPKVSFSFEQDITPYGPSVKLESAKITANPKIPQQVEKIVTDDLLANEAMNLLYQKGFDEHYLTKIFSMGNLGKESSQKIVPTRWSITATDDMIGKKIIDDIKDFPQSNYYAYFGGYLGNYYVIMLFPDAWSYELFEISVSSKKVWTDHEDVFGRKTYAEHTVGGYYAARLAILEQLKKVKKQATVLTLRFVTDDYYLPLGVWVVRQATRAAMQSQAIEFASKELMLQYAKMIAKKKFGLDIEFIIKQSKILSVIQTQKKLSAYN